MDNKKDQYDDYMGENLDFWNNDEPIIKSQKDNILKFIILKILTILLVLYVLNGYMSDISYFFSTEKVAKLETINIDTINKIDLNKWKKHANKQVSISGWVEIRSSFTMKMNFTRYQILKLYRKPVFVAIEKGKKGYITEIGTVNDIPNIYDISGRLLTYKELASGFSLLNPYQGLIEGYRRATKRKLPKNSILIIAHQKPKSDYWSIIIPILLLLYLLYSMFSIIRIFKITKGKK